MPDPRLPPSALDPTFASGPHDRCVRCGRPTPLGVSLCEYDNPGNIGAPSATQLHATMLAGVGVGVVALALLGKLLLAGVGPFDARVLSTSIRPDGGADVVLQVTNLGSKDAAASCQISRPDYPRPSDPMFLTQRIAAGATVRVTQSIPEPIDGPYTPGGLTATCR